MGMPSGGSLGYATLLVDHEPPRRAWRNSTVGSAASSAAGTRKASGPGNLRFNSITASNRIPGIFDPRFVGVTSRFWYNARQLCGLFYTEGSKLTISDARSLEAPVHRTFRTPRVGVDQISGGLSYGDFGREATKGDPKNLFRAPHPPDAGWVHEMQTAP